MSKYVPYLLIGVLIIGALIFVSGKFNSSRNNNYLNDNIVPSQQEVSEYETVQDDIVSEVGPSIKPVSEVDLSKKSSVQSAIDAELNQLDQELSGINDSNLDVSGLSDDQLGL